MRCGEPFLKKKMNERGTKGGNEDTRVQNIWVTFAHSSQYQFFFLIEKL